MKPYVFILVSFLTLHYVFSFTGNVVMDSCYDTTRRGYGFRVINGPIVSRVNCTMYFSAPNTDLYIAVRLNSVNLKRIGSSCPTFTVYTFSTWRQDPVPDEWRGSEVSVPADPALLRTCNCSTYLQECSNLPFDETKTPGLMIMLSYNPDDATRTVKREGAFDVTISSFMRGASFTCPKGHFLCWHYKYRCLPESLLCDGFDNCFDNSDEFDYSCTGRIGNMTLPVFIVMLLACLVALAILIWLSVLIIRRRVANKKMARNEWGEVVKASDYPPTNASQQSFAEKDPGAGSMTYPLESLPAGSVFEESSTIKPMLA